MGCGVVTVDETLSVTSLDKPLVEGVNSTVVDLSVGLFSAVEGDDVSSEAVVLEVLAPAG